jgi:hypothetical protein
VEDYTNKYNQRGGMRACGALPLAGPHRDHTAAAL